MISSDNLRFKNTRRDFTIALNKRVNEYFKINGVSRYANTEMVVKSIFMLSLYFVPYTLILTEVVSGALFTFFLVVVMGLGLSGIGLCVMHDGNHGAYSSKNWVNTTIGYTLNLIGANSFNWKVQHNVLHHSFTNVYQADEDITQKPILRFTPDAEWRWFHKYQFIYAWFLYGLMTLVWIFYRDFSQLFGYQKGGFVKLLKSSPKKEWMILIITKIVYISYIFLVPLLLTSWVWWQVIIGIVTMHYVTGFILAIIFQPAHVIEGSDFPKPDENQSLEENWAIHQLRTTTNFANNSKWFTWVVGGLNYQIEHHLFPGICHIHYDKIARIVKSTAQEFGLPYKSEPSFAKALRGHVQLLKQLGTRPSN